MQNEIEQIVQLYNNNITLENNATIVSVIAAILLAVCTFIVYIIMRHNSPDRTFNGRIPAVIAIAIFTCWFTYAEGSNIYTRNKTDNITSQLRDSIQSSYGLYICNSDHALDSNIDTLINSGISGAITASSGNDVYYNLYIVNYGGEYRLCTSDNDSGSYSSQYTTITETSE